MHCVCPRDLINMSSTSQKQNFLHPTSFKSIFTSVQSPSEVCYQRLLISGLFVGMLCLYVLGVNNVQMHPQKNLSIELLEGSLTCNIVRNNSNFARMITCVTVVLFMLLT